MSGNRFAEGQRPRWQALVVGLVLSLAGVVSGCKGPVGPEPVPDPQPGPVSQSVFMNAVISDTLCAVMQNSWPVATLASNGAQPGLAVGALLIDGSGHLLGQMILELHGTIAVGSYPLAAVTGLPGSRSGNLGQFVATSRATLWATDATHVGSLEITRLDTAAGRVEGTFSFDGVNPVDGSIRTVRQGKFASALTVNP